MSGVCHKLSEWLRSPFSAVVYFQKHFVDDVADTVKRQKEQFDRHSREMQERAVQLHLDKLEGKYLCCVCGRPGETREDDDAVYDTFSIVTLPQRSVIEDGIRRVREVEEAEGQRDAHEIADERRRRRRHSHRRPREDVRKRGKSHPTDRGHSAKADRQLRKASPLSRNVSSALYSDDDLEASDEGVATTSPRGGLGRRHSDSFRFYADGDGGSNFGTQQGSSTASRSGTPTRTNTSVDFYGNETTPDGRTADAASSKANAQSAAQNNQRNGDDDGRDFPALDANLVPLVEVQNMMYKIHHAVLNREARTKRKAVHVHKDKGLTKIAESEIDTYSNFFQRPVHGFLCTECYTGARKRLDTVTEQIQTILFKARHPLLRKVSTKEVSGLTSTGQLSAGLISSIYDIQRKWARQQEASAIRATRIRRRREMAEKDGVSDVGLAVAFTDEDEGAADLDKEGGALLGRGPHLHNGAAAMEIARATLPDATIVSLRTTVKCAVCQHRRSCFFNRASVLFLCQFCTARDRYYRENAVCINDEPMAAETVHLLSELARYHEGVHRAQELRQLPQTELKTAPTTLFSREANLFTIQTIAPELLPSAAAAPIASSTHLRNGEKHAQLSSQSTSSVGNGDHGIEEAGFSYDEDGNVVRPPVFIKMEPRPYVDIRGMRRRESDTREIVGSTQRSLFESTKLELPAAMDLFKGNDKNATLVLAGDNLLQPAPTTNTMDDLFAFPLSTQTAQGPSEDVVDYFSASRTPQPTASTVPQQQQQQLPNGHQPSRAADLGAYGFSSGVPMAPAAATTAASVPTAGFTSGAPSSFSPSLFPFASPLPPPPPHPDLQGASGQTASPPLQRDPVGPYEANGEEEEDDPAHNAQFGNSEWL